MPPCTICHLAKSHILPFSLSSSHATQPLALIHTDLWGLALHSSTTGARYFLIFIDDYSRYTWIYFLLTKDQTLPTFINFHKMVENQLTTSIKCIQSNNGGEFLTFKPYFEAHGIVHQFSCPHTPQQNSRAERKIRHLVETGLTLLTQGSLFSKYWSYAFQTVVYLINILPAKLLNFQSTLQVLFHKIPNYRHLKVFRCLCFPSLRLYTQHKLSSRSTACLFLGYASAHKGYIFFDVSSGRVYISRSVIFHETSFPFQMSLPSSSSFSQSSFSTPVLISQPNPSTPPSISQPSSSTPALFPQPNSSTPSSPPTCNPTTNTTSIRTTSGSLPPLLQVQFATNSSSIPSFFSHLPLNTHPMVTRANSGIYKKKSFLVQQTGEPRIYSQASKSDPWV